MKVYLGGIGNESNWRDEFFSQSSDLSLQIVEKDTGSKDSCDYLLYVITPKMKEISAVVNVVNDSNHQKGKTILCTLMEEQGDNFTPHQEKSLVATGKMIEVNGGKWFNSINETIGYLKENM